MLWTLLLACKPDPVPFDSLAVFPSSELMDQGVVTIPADLLPVADTPTPVERLRHRNGFSVVQSTVFDLGIDIDPSSLPGPMDVDQAGSVQIWDLDTGERLPAWAEVDAYPQDSEIPTLLVRPGSVLPLGHRVAVVVTDQVLDVDGNPLSATDWWSAAQDEIPLEGADSEHWHALADELAELGIQGIVAATDFPIGDGTHAMRAMADQLQTPSSYTLRKVRDSELGDSVQPQTWLLIEGSFETDTWLLNDDALVLDDQGLPILQGTESADLMVLVPESVRDAGSAKAVWIFGHGIFSGPDDYLDADGDPSGVVALANEAQVIVVGTRWRGLTRTDLPSAVAAGNDFGRIPQVTDKLAQGVANTLALLKLITDTDLMDQEPLAGLWDGGSLGYYGISLGGIQGATFMALQDEVPYAVLHVGGSAWSTMLERSANWTVFEELVLNDFPSAKDRQILYAVSQLYWDTADPAGYTAELAQRNTLWQYSIGDEQVPNMTTELLARGTGMTQVEPAVYDISGLEQSADTGLSSGVVQFDPQVAIPNAGNRPGETSGAHNNPRVWTGTLLQTATYLDPATPGRIQHFCGDAPCSQDNSGP